MLPYFTKSIWNIFLWIKSSTFDWFHLTCKIFLRRATAQRKVWHMSRIFSFEKQPPGRVIVEKKGWQISPQAKPLNKGSTKNVRQKKVLHPSGQCKHLIPAFLTAPRHMPPSTCQLLTTTCQLPPANRHLPTVNCHLQTVNCQTKIWRKKIHEKDFPKKISWKKFSQKKISPEKNIF